MGASLPVSGGPGGLGEIEKWRKFRRWLWVILAPIDLLILVEFEEWC